MNKYLFAIMKEKDAFSFFITVVKYYGAYYGGSSISSYFYPRLFFYTRTLTYDVSSQLSNVVCLKHTLDDSQCLK
jgi:hypothetical protein